MLQFGCVKFRQGRIQIQGLIEVFKHATIIENIAKFFAVIKPVDVGNRLLNRVFERRCFALDYGQRDAVDEEDQIRTEDLMAAAALDFKFLSDMVDVVGWFFPVDVLQGRAFNVAINGLLNAFTKTEQVVNLFVGADQSAKGQVFERLDKG